MNLNTLIYIKDLLEENIQYMDAQYKQAADKCEKVERENGFQWNTEDKLVNDDVRRCRDTKATKREDLNRAKEALEDFMSKDWS